MYLEGVDEARPSWEFEMFERKLLETNKKAGISWLLMAGGFNVTSKHQSNINIE